VEGIRRVIVGASGSPGSLRALRYAEDLARAYDAILMPVHAWTPPGGDIADHRAPCGYLRRIWQAEAARQLQDAMTAGSPGGISPPGSHRSERESLLSLRSSHPKPDAISFSQAQWAKRCGCLAVRSFHHLRAFLNGRSRLYFCRAQRIR
jgi:nucleotide-binding universal stress UspA family protein